MERIIRCLANTPAVIRRILSGFYLALIALLSLLPSDSFKKVPTFFENEDIIAHFLMYGGLATLFCWTFHRRNCSPLLYYSAIILICCGYGILMEILQGMIHSLDRSFSWSDIVSNLAGICVFIPIKERFLPGKLDNIEQTLRRP